MTTPANGAGEMIGAIRKWFYRHFGPRHVVAWRWCTHEHAGQWRDGKPTEQEKKSGSYKDWIEYRWSK